MCSIQEPDGPCQVEAFVGAQSYHDPNTYTCSKLDRATYIGHCKDGTLDGLSIVKATGSTNSMPHSALAYFSQGRIAYPWLIAFLSEGKLTLGISEKDNIYGCVVFGRGGWDQSDTRESCPTFKKIFGNNLFSEANGRALLDGSLDLTSYNTKFTTFVTKQ
jgi:hypothetical protein